MNNSSSPATTTTNSRSELLDAISSEAHRQQEERPQQSNQDPPTSLTTTRTTTSRQVTGADAATRRHRQEHDPVTRNLLIQAIRAIMQAAATIFGLGVGVGLILGDSLRSRPLVVANPNISLEERMPGELPDDDESSVPRSAELTPQGEISARPPPTEPLPSCCGRSMYRARSNVQEAPPSSTTAALLPSQ